MRIEVCIFVIALATLFAVCHTESMSPTSLSMDTSRGIVIGQTTPLLDSHAVDDNIDFYEYNLYSEYTGVSVSGSAHAFQLLQSLIPVAFSTDVSHPLLKPAAYRNTHSQLWGRKPERWFYFSNDC